MTPCKIERGCQSSRATGQEPSCSTSQKRRSQSRPQDEADPKKGRTEGDGRTSKVQVGIDWSLMGNQKPIPKLDPKHPSFKPDPLGDNTASQQSRTKSIVTQKGLHKLSTRSAPAGSELSEGQINKAGGRTPGMSNAEKTELKEKPYHWISARIHHLDPRGYEEEIHSFWHFQHNQTSFALKIIVIVDWGRQCMDVGVHYPIPVFPNYLFNEFAGSRQGGGQVPIKPLYVNQPGGDVRVKCLEAWIWMVSILQFWAGKASVADRVLYGG